MFQRNNKKGFTLAELLIVVAIIAVLVAIAIPVFTNQLEKSREATDEANIRSLYAETVAAVLGCDRNASTSLAGAELKVAEGTGDMAGVYEGKATIKLTHQKPKLEGKDDNDEINIGGVKLKSSDFLKDGYAHIYVNSAGDAPKIFINETESNSFTVPAGDTGDATGTP